MRSFHSLFLSAMLLFGGCASLEHRSEPRSELASRTHLESGEKELDSVLEVSAIALAVAATILFMFVAGLRNVDSR